MGLEEVRTILQNAQQPTFKSLAKKEPHRLAKKTLAIHRRALLRIIVAFRSAKVAAEKVTFTERKATRFVGRPIDLEAFGESSENESLLWRSER